MDPIITLTVVGLAGLFLLNPGLLVQGLAVVQGIITRTLTLASGAKPAARPGPAAGGMSA